MPYQIGDSHAEAAKRLLARKQSKCVQKKRVRKTTNVAEKYECDPRMEEARITQKWCGRIGPALQTCRLILSGHVAQKGSNRENE